MKEKRPISQTKIAIVVILFFGISSFAFWLKFHDVVTNYFKYFGYAATLIFASHKEIFKQDEKTNKWELQSLSHWIGPFIYICAICLFSVSSDVADAKEKKQTAITDSAQRQTEEANRKAEIADLKRALAEQKLRVMAIQAQSKQNQVVQVKLAKRARLEDRRQNEATRHEVRERAVDQKNLITRKNLADVQRSVQDLKAVQAGFQRNEKGFQLTGEAINRSVNQIESVRFSYQVMLPLGEPGMAAYRKTLDDKIIQFYPNHLVDSKDYPSDVGLRVEGGAYVAASGKMASNLRVEILPNSLLYPSTFDPAFHDLLSYPIHLKMSRRQTKENSSPYPISDLNIDTPPGTLPQVYYFLGDDSLRLVFTNVLGFVSKNTDNIWSLLDLNNCKVEVSRNNYDYITKEFSDKPLPQLQRDCILTEATIDINN